MSPSQFSFQTDHDPKGKCLSWGRIVKVEIQVGGGDGHTYWCIMKMSGILLFFMSYLSKTIMAFGKRNCLKTSYPAKFQNLPSSFSKLSG